MIYHLFDSFRDLFEGQAYLHRKSNLGDFVAMHLYEDLHRLGRSEKYVARVDTGISVLNTQNLRQGIKARRGDGSFGEIVPNTDAIQDEGFAVHRGPIATIEIGVEVKNLDEGNDQANRPCDKRSEGTGPTLSVTRRKSDLRRRGWHQPGTVLYDL